MAEKSLTGVLYKYFEKAPTNDYRTTPGTIVGFRDELSALSDDSKDALASGIKDGSLTYPEPANADALRALPLNHYTREV